jgi:hypothetical protein
MGHSAAGISLSGLGVNPRSVLVEFVVENVEAGMDFLRVVPFFPRECHSISAPYLFIHRKRFIIVGISIVVK